jgi:HK97 gp10 family phage protein
MQVQMYLKGIDQLERQANKLIKEVNEGRQKILLDQAKFVRDRIREKAPRGPTSNLKAAAYASSLPASLNGPAVAFAGIRPRKAPHAHLVEFGHGGPHPAPPHPFLRPAWDSCKEEVQRNIAAALGKSIEVGASFSQPASVSGGSLSDYAKGRMRE